jgi:hypothetical protein
MSHGVPSVVNLAQTGPSAPVKAFEDVDNDGMTLQATPSDARSNGTDHAGLLILDRAECLELLARGGLGRIAINVGALPAILPVRFGLVGEQVVLCVAVGSTVDRATRNAVVAFEADGAGVDGEWSVTLVGVARELSNASELTRANALALPRWSNDEHRFVAISTDHISGRRATGHPSGALDRTPPGR